MFNENIHMYETIPSTNDEAKQQAFLGAPSRSVYVAKKQTLGKGRLGRNFLSSDEEGLYFSILIKPVNEKIPFPLELLTLHSAMCVCKSIEKLSGQKCCSIKWPNDVLINNKKVCGILLESCIKFGRVDYVVVGIGINLNNSYIDNSIIQKASSLYIELKKSFSKTEMLNSVLDHFFQFNFNLQSYKNYCVSLFKKVKTKKNSQEISGIAIDIDDSGNLIIITECKQKIKVNSGDVCVQDIY